MHGGRLGARLDVQVLDAVQGLQAHRGAQRGGRHRHVHGAVQIDAVPGEPLVLQFLDLDVQVARRAATWTDLALAGEPDPNAVTDAGRDVGPNGPAGPHPTLAVALPAGVGDDPLFGYQIARSTSPRED